MSTASAAGVYTFTAGSYGAAVSAQVLHAGFEELFLSSLLTDVVRCQGEQEQRASGYILPEGRYIDHDQTGVERLDQEHAEDRSEHVANAAREGYAAQDNAGDGIELKVDVRCRLSGVHAGREYDTAQSCQHADQGSS